MATTAHHGQFHERRTAERRRFAYPVSLRADGTKVSWGGIFGGVLVALGLLFLLAALGAAVGITLTQPGEIEGGTLGTAAGIWAGVSLLLALFVGGMVSTRIGAISDRATGFFEGALVWVVSVLLVVYSASAGVGMIAGGAFSMLGGAAQTLAAVAQSQGGVDISGNVDQILARLKDPRTARQIASASGMQQAEVEQTLSETAERVQANRDNPAQAAEEAKKGVGELMQQAKSSGALEQKAEELKPGATRGAWIAFGALVLSLAAAVVGAMLGRRRQGVAAS
jgi:hypothetical protein